MFSPNSCCFLQDREMALATGELFGTCCGACPPLALTRGALFDIRCCHGSTSQPFNLLKIGNQGRWCPNRNFCDDSLVASNDITTLPAVLLVGAHVSCLSIIVNEHPHIYMYTSSSPGLLPSIAAYLCSLAFELSSVITLRDVAKTWAFRFSGYLSH